MVNPQATDNSDRRQVVDTAVRIRNVTSNVTDSSLTVLGNGNNITIHVHP